MATPALAPREGPLPVTLLSGFLGAGKTTLLEYILTNKQGIRSAVVVNDMAEINIDASLIKGTQLLQTEEKMLELHNGCICCTLREDLLIGLREMSKNKEIDVVVIESTGISEPMQVAETFFLDPQDGKGTLVDIARLDNCVTVVDASTFAMHLNSVANVRETFNDNGSAKDPSLPEPPTTEEDERNISHLLVDQVEFANVIILNKMDLVDEKTKVLTLDFIKKLNPHAEVISTTKSVVPMNKLLLTKNFRTEYAESAKGWMDDVTSGVKHTPETEEYGIGSFIYSADAPFHPKRLHEFMTTYFVLEQAAADEEDGGHNSASAAKTAGGNAITTDENRKNARGDADALQLAAARTQLRNTTFGTLMRSKGYLWIGSLDRLGGIAEWNHAGGVLTLGYAGGWGQINEVVAKKDFVHAPTNNLVPSATSGGSAADDGIVPCQQVVLIGQALKKDELTAALNACLLTEGEQSVLKVAAMEFAEIRDQNPTMTPPQVFEDPFEEWPQDDEEGHDHDHHGHSHSHKEQQAPKKQVVSSPSAATSGIAPKPKAKKTTKVGLGQVDVLSLVEMNTTKKKTAGKPLK